VYIFVCKILVGRRTACARTPPSSVWPGLTSPQAVHTVHTCVCVCVCVCVYECVYICMQNSRCAAHDMRSYTSMQCLARPNFTSSSAYCAHMCAYVCGCVGV